MAKIIDFYYNKGCRIVPQTEFRITEIEGLEYNSSYANLLKCTTRLAYENAIQLNEAESFDLFDKMKSTEDLKYWIQSISGNATGKFYLVCFVKYKSPKPTIKKLKKKKGRYRKYRKLIHGGVDVLIAWEMEEGELIQIYKRKERHTQYPPRIKKLYMLWDLLHKKEQKETKIFYSKRGKRRVFKNLK